MLTWRITGRPGVTVATFHGVLDETVDLTPLKRSLSGRVFLKLADVEGISSLGIRPWLDFVSDLPDARPLVLTHCSPAVVDKLNVVPSFAGGGEVRSILGPYRCQACRHHEEKVLDVALDLARGVPSFVCDACGGALELDDLPERYLLFLKRTRT